MRPFEVVIIRLFALALIAFGLWLASTIGSHSQELPQDEGTATAVIFTHIVSRTGVATSSVVVTLPMNVCENFSASLMSSYRILTPREAPDATRYWDVICWRNLSHDYTPPSPQG